MRKRGESSRIAKTDLAPVAPLPGLFISGPGGKWAQATSAPAPEPAGERELPWPQICQDFAAAFVPNHSRWRVSADSS